MRDRKHVTRLLGETLRELGILAVALAPLDATFGGSAATTRSLVAAVLIGALLIGVGLLMETQT